MIADEAFYFYIFSGKTGTFEELRFSIQGNNFLKWLWNAAEYGAKIIYFNGNSAFCIITIYFSEYFSQSDRWKFPEPEY